jgi:hypothetical protein
MAVSKWRAKVEVVDALQYTGDNESEMLAFCPHLKVIDGALELWMIPVSINGWVLHKPDGQWMQIENDDFIATYDPGGPV